MSISQDKIFQQKNGWIHTCVIIWTCVVYSCCGFWPSRSAHAQAITRGGAGGPAKLGRPLGLDSFSSRAIGKPAEGIPLITDLTVVDLDGDGLKDILLCDGSLNKVSWIRQVRLGVGQPRWSC